MADRELVHAIRRALSTPKRVCEQLGLKIEQASGSYVLCCCPVHAEKTGSMSVRVKDGTIGVRCFGCGFTGDVLTLVAAVHGLDSRNSFREVLATAAELAGMHAEADSIRAGRAAPERAPLPALPPEPERDYPPAAEVAELWGSTIQVTDDAQASELLVSRRIDPDAVARLDAARVLRVDTHDTRIPDWARFKGRLAASKAWPKSGHRMLLPVYDSDGAIRSVRAWLLTGDPTLPKRVPPVGFKASELVLASRDAVDMLRGDASPSRVIITEGEPDFLVRSVVSPGEAVVGVLSGSWHEGFARRVPYGSLVVVRTHRDPAGNRYAAKVIESVKSRARTARWMPDEEPNVTAA
jgi:hypothetical protein